MSTRADGTVTVDRAAVLAFLRAELAKAEKELRAREAMAKCAARPTTPAEWRTIMAMTPPRARGPMPTAKQRREQAAVQNRIAAKLRRSVASYRAALALLGDGPASGASA